MRSNGTITTTGGESFKGNGPHATDLHHPFLHGGTDATTGGCVRSGA